MTLPKNVEIAPGSSVAFTSSVGELWVVYVV